MVPWCAAQQRTLLSACLFTFLNRSLSARAVGRRSVVGGLLAGALESMVVLLVEDDPVSNAVMTRLLQSLGFGTVLSSISMAVSVRTAFRTIFSVDGLGSPCLQGKRLIYLAKLKSMAF